MVARCRVGTLGGKRCGGGGGRDVASVALAAKHAVWCGAVVVVVATFRIFPGVVLILMVVIATGYRWLVFTRRCNVTPRIPSARAFPTYESAGRNIGTLGLTLLQ